MKILIGYDGSHLADLALDDLQNAGLGDDVEASILTVAEIWMPPPDGNPADKNRLGVEYDWIKRHEIVEKATLKVAETLSAHAREKLTQRFPAWKIQTAT